MKPITLTGTTNTAGALTVTSDSTYLGAVYAVQLVDGSFADGVDITLTSEQDNLSIPILVKANFNTDQMVYPRVAEALNTDGTALTTYAMPLVNGKLKMVIAQGGSVATGGCTIYLIDYL